MYHCVIKLRLFTAYSSICVVYWKVMNVCAESRAVGTATVVVTGCDDYVISGSNPLRVHNVTRCQHFIW